MPRLFRPLLPGLFLLLISLPPLLLDASPAAADMTAREFIEMPWTRDKLAIMNQYVEQFQSLGYAEVPDVYTLTARMELNVHTDGSYSTWLDILALTAALDLGMHR